MGKINTIIRPMNSDDIPIIAGWFSDFPDISMFDRGLPVPVGRDFVEESWKPAIQYNDPPKAFWYVAENEAKQPMGICGLQGINYIHGDAVTPIFVAKDFRNKGLAMLLMNAMINLAFSSLRLNRLSTMYRADNEASKKLCQLLGFTIEGKIREGWYSGGRYGDIVMVGLLKSEWAETCRAIESKLENIAFDQADGFDPNG